MAKNELVSLGLIFHHPLHAYAINAVVKGLGLEHWALISQPSIYTALARLEKDGCVSVSSEKVGNMPDRKVYAITDAGRVRLADELREALGATGQEASQFHLGLLFMFGLPLDEIRAIMQKRVDSYSEIIAIMDEKVRFHQDLQEPISCISVSAAREHYIVEQKATVDLLAALTGKKVITNAAHLLCRFMRELDETKTVSPHMEKTV